MNSYTYPRHSSDEHHHAICQCPDPLAPPAKALVRDIGAYSLQECDPFVGFGTPDVSPDAHGEKMPSLSIFERFRTITAKRKTITSVTSSNSKAETTLKALPPFWKNGNSYCFVLPMIAGVFVDFVMSLLCEYCYFSLPQQQTDLLLGFYLEH